MSSTRVVPAGVPSVAHSSEPVDPSFAVKKTRLPTTVRLLGDEPVVRLGLISLTRNVPAAVPSLRHSSKLLADAGPSVAEKYATPLRATILGNCIALVGPGRMSLTMTVPAAVPSVRHSSWPVDA